MNVNARNVSWRKRLVIWSVSMTSALMLFLSAYAIGYLIQQRQNWESLLKAEASGFGHMVARDDIRKGKVRLYELVTQEQESSNTGKREGPFEVWTWPAGTDTPSRIDAEAFVEGYNDAMHRMISKTQSSVEKK